MLNLKKRISNAETERIIEVLDKLYANDINIEPSIVFDSWKIQIYYKGLVLTQNCWHPDYEEINYDIDDYSENIPEAKIDFNYNITGAIELSPSKIYEREQNCNKKLGMFGL